MKGDKIPETDHIARFCRPSHVNEGKIQATAFWLRDEEESLSVNWLEFLNCSSRNSEIDELRKNYSKTLTVGASAMIAVLNVGEIRLIVREESQDNRNLEVLHDPIKNGDQSHSEVCNLKPDDQLIAELILEVIQETYTARHQ